MHPLRLLALLAATTSPPVARAADPALTSRAIDPTLFRDGAVQRFSGIVEAWSYVCDDVAGLKQRFCSLRSQVMDGTGSQVALLVISTGEDGRPAALLKLKADRFGPGGIEVTPLGSPPVAAKPPSKARDTSPANARPSPPVKVYPAQCDVGVCQLIWTLDPLQIAALRSGAGLRITGQPLDVVVSGRGFAAAIDASLKPR
jgi:invasion protein IalB